VFATLKGEGSFHLNRIRVDGTGRRAAERGSDGWETIERRDISEALVSGNNVLEMDYVRLGVPFFCTPDLQVRIWVEGELVVDRQSSSEDCDFEWYWSINGDTGAIEQLPDGSGLIPD
jgi:hypothetical protein